MANPGTAVTRLFVEGTVADQVAITKDDSTANKEFEDFFKEHGLEGAARESGLITGKAVTSAVPNTTLITITKADSPGARLVPKQETISVSSPAARPRPIVISTQPVLLPRPASQTHQIIGTPPQQGHHQTPTAIIATPVAIASPGSSFASSTPGSRKRRAEFDGDYLDISDRKRKRTPARSVDKGGKGLRHFSMKVCEKVQNKRITTYNEVADELVQEFSNDPQRHLHPNDQTYDQKNIRRRVYDALNVLMAMNIISKEKKEIKWVGLPTNSAQECAHLEDQKRDRLERIRQKQLQLQELILQQIAFKNLVERNKKLEKQNGPPLSNAAIHLPFIIVNTSKKTVIDCSISSDKTEYLFNFDNTFEIHDDIEVLKRMGMAFGLEKGSCPTEKLKIARSMVPKALEPYVNQLVTGITGLAILPSGSSPRPHNSQQSISSPLPHTATAVSSFPTTSSTNHSSQRTSRASSTTSMTSNRSGGHRTHTPSPSFGSGSESENETDEDDSHDCFTENSNNSHQ